MRKHVQIVLLALIGLILVGCSFTNGRPVFTPRLSDDAITTSVHQAFVNNRILSDAPVHVETHQGNVVLSGYVKTIRQSDTAADVAAKVPGVKFVQNNIIVRK
ncbi:BON domain-containing protein [Legionella jordanis]|uniref:Phospholipid binding protein n=1 Tax=Legionella jordanis TaxID=456 RepID=A0A0W0VDZ3_9GAMM|nr:BON domain-containing protein [Legionella jordanis]KTD18320.1 phospholipid binding protein [Legionella jordanis]RMX05236.1 BON domain-containing protein [Legionella jordanis]VEH13334.1 phospholipid binding protein [Legionella jordanis]HAT8713680.1 BON domain-containing protein [Legionella jordanis]